MRSALEFSTPGIWQAAKSTLCLTQKSLMSLMTGNKSGAVVPPRFTMDTVVELSERYSNLRSGPREREGEAGETPGGVERGPEDREGSEGGGGGQRGGVGDPWKLLETSGSLWNLLEGWRRREGPRGPRGVRGGGGGWGWLGLGLGTGRGARGEGRGTCGQRARGARARGAEGGLGKGTRRAGDTWGWRWRGLGREHERG